MSRPQRTPAALRALRLALALAAAAWPAAQPARAQQPFVTDDADVTAAGRFHFEFANEFDLLQRSAFPALRQNTATFTLAYGLRRGAAEVSLTAPALAIFNARGTAPRTARGVGDLGVALKYNFLKERDGSRRPALAASLGLGLPTGDAARGLGSGLYDLHLNGIMQKGLPVRTTLRLNGGLVLAGNDASGALGVRGRGIVYSASGSLVRAFTGRLQLGIELAGARPGRLGASRGQLQGQVGGNYAVTEKLSLDFGVLGGRYAASPRLGAQLGVSIDF